MSKQGDYGKASGSEEPQLPENTASSSKSTLTTTTTTPPTLFNASSSSPTKRQNHEIQEPEQVLQPKLVKRPRTSPTSTTRKDQGENREEGTGNCDSSSSNNDNNGNNDKNDNNDNNDNSNNSNSNPETPAPNSQHVQKTSSGNASDSSEYNSEAEEAAQASQQESQSGEYEPNKGRFSREEKRHLFELIREDPGLFYAFLHQRKERMYGTKSWMHEISRRYNKTAKSKRSLEAIRHHLMFRRVRRKGTKTEVLRSHAQDCRQPETCTKCLIFQRICVQAHIAQCGYSPCESCNKSLPHAAKLVEPSPNKKKLIESMFAARDNLINAQSQNRVNLAQLLCSQDSPNSANIGVQLQPNSVESQQFGQTELDMQVLGQLEHFQAATRALVLIGQQQLQQQQQQQQLLQLLQHSNEFNLASPFPGLHQQLQQQQQQQLQLGQSEIQQRLLYLEQLKALLSQEGRRWDSSLLGSLAGPNPGNNLSDPLSILQSGGNISPSVVASLLQNQHQHNAAGLLNVPQVLASQAQSGLLSQRQESSSQASTNEEDTNSGS
eukprot:CAMPEP_0184543544 /NCGR_PEP_ID=MMETSP0199_2-20130426/3002_1 /TAXON_ID=1112570 /ORGANISM="Thraustochytrium sp., Strain LLF1b" /LENGTH=549 /DNA_ID=CAMNT_0026937583 /DNA_START=239 /DNA_END=1884 /DNA_ORIENTATION=+